MATEQCGCCGTRKRLHLSAQQPAWFHNTPASGLAWPGNLADSVEIPPTKRILEAGLFEIQIQTYCLLSKGRFYDSDEREGNVVLYQRRAELPLPGCTRALPESTRGCTTARAEHHMGFTASAADGLHKADVTWAAANTKSRVLQLEHNPATASLLAHPIKGSLPVAGKCHRSAALHTL